jgi:hypothetical protein
MSSEIIESKSGSFSLPKELQQIMETAAQNLVEDFLIRSPCMNDIFEGRKLDKDGLLAKDKK